jgi:D-aminopeptidase
LRCCPAVSAEEAKFGEIIINALAEGYHDTGFGVAVHPAGENCSSAEFPDMAHAKVKKLWDEAFAFRVNCLPWEANMDSEVARRAAEDELDAAVEQKRKEEIQVARGKAEAKLKVLDSLHAKRASMVPHHSRSESQMLEFHQTCQELDAMLAKMEAELAPARRALARLG